MMFCDVNNEGLKMKVFIWKCYYLKCFFFNYVISFFFKSGFFFSSHEDDEQVDEDNESMMKMLKSDLIKIWKRESMNIINKER